MKIRNLLPLSFLVTAPILFSSSISCSSQLRFNVKEQVLEEFAGSNIVKSTRNIAGISSIYRESKKDYSIISYLKDRVKAILVQDPGFHSDEAHNLWFDIPASPGCEDYPTVILQGHTDMVLALSDPSLIDDVKENGIEVVLEENIAHSKDWKTSLGADNGAGCALALVLIKERDNFKHGKLRFLFTADEESGTIGAKYIYDHKDENKIFLNQDNNYINYLINLDAEAKYSIYRSCAGAFYYSYDKTFTSTEIQKDNVFELYMEGFAGGHSGNDMDKMRLSSDRAIFEILDSLIDNGNAIQLISFDHKLHDSGQEVKYLSSQIIQNSHVVFAISNDMTLQDLKDFIETYASQNWTKYTGEDWNQIKDKTYVSKPTINLDEPFIDSADSEKIIKFIGHCKNPNNITDGYYYGIYDWIGEGDNYRPKTNTNIGPISIEANNDNVDWSFEAFTREATKEAMQPHINTYTNIWSSYFPGTPVNKLMEFAPWEAKKDSKLLNLVFNSYIKVNAKPWFKDSRGSVEPVWWTSANPNLDCACIGPYIDHAHSINEILDVSTINQAFNALVITLEQFK